MTRGAREPTRWHQRALSRHLVPGDPDLTGAGQGRAMGRRLRSRGRLEKQLHRRGLSRPKPVTRDAPGAWSGDRGTGGP